MKRRPGDVGLNLRTGISDLRPTRSCVQPAKSKQRKDAVSVRSRRLRARLRTRRCAALQPRCACEMGGWWSPSNLCPFEDLDRVALGELDDRLLPARLDALAHPAPLRLRLHLEDVHAEHRDVEQLLHGLAHLRAMGVWMDAEDVLAVADQAVALLRHDRREQDLVRMQAHVALLWTAGRADSVTRSERAQTTWDTFSSDSWITTASARFLNDFATVSSSSPTTRTSGACLPHPATSSDARLVEGSSKAEPSTSAKVSPWTWAASAARSAARCTFLFTFTSNERMLGGKATPPPVNCGARVVPARARPVPFWRHGFERPPATSPRDLAPRVPARSAFSSARTASCTRCCLISAPKTDSSSSTSFAALPEASSTGALLAAMRHVLPDLEQAALGAGHGALDEQQPTLRVHRVDDETDLRAPLPAHPAGHPHALEDARGRRGGADRARLADVVRPVRDRAAREVVPFDRALEALADADPAHLHVVARLERLRRQRLADDGLGRA